MDFFRNVFFKIGLGVVTIVTAYDGGNRDILVNKFTVTALAYRQTQTAADCQIIRDGRLFCGLRLGAETGGGFLGRKLFAEIMEREAGHGRWN